MIVSLKLIFDHQNYIFVLKYLVTRHPCPI